MIEKDIEQQAMAVISGSLVSNGITGWNLYQQFDFNTAVFPVVWVVCKSFTEDNPTLNLGVGKAKLEIQLIAYKQETSASEYKSTVDAALNPFCEDDITARMNLSGSLIVKNVAATGGRENETLEDGWSTIQAFEIVCCPQ